MVQGGIAAFALNALAIFGDPDQGSFQQFVTELLINTTAGPTISVILSTTAPEPSQVFDLHSGQLWLNTDIDSKYYLMVMRYTGLDWVMLLNTLELFDPEYFKINVMSGSQVGPRGTKGLPGPEVPGPPGNPGLPGLPGNYVIPYTQIVDRVVEECTTDVKIVGPAVINLKGKTFPLSVQFKVTVTTGVEPYLTVTEAPAASISLGDLPAGTPLMMRGQSLIIGHQLGSSVSVTLKCVDGSKLSRIRSVPTRLQVLLNPDA